MSHVGSILATPRGSPRSPFATVAEIDDEALAPLFAELAATPGSIEILVDRRRRETWRRCRALIARLRAAGLRFEAMATGPAARVYNVLLDENRRVAALLIAAP